jgi:glycosyltransferase involved in cell wall biosynthesis
MHPAGPKISIITVCYNAAATIEKTLISVQQQDYPHIEHLIIDGQSTDDTLSIVAKYPHISAVYSQSDKGIYDAMNKGIARATGDYLWFLHADDQIYASDTLRLALQDHQHEDFIYGRAMLVNEQGLKRPLEARKAHPKAQTLSWKTMKEGMVICHQAMLVRVKLAPLYNLEYNLVGDLDWVINILKQTSSVRDCGQIMCTFVEGGTSTQHRKASLKQRFQILRKHFGLLPTLWQHALIAVSALRRGSIR